MSEAAGEYNRLITIEEKTGVRNDANQLVDAWQQFGAKRWAKPIGQSGMGVVRMFTDSAAGVEQSGNNYVWRVRYTDQITADMRVVHRGVIYDIKQVKQDLARRAWTDLVCETGLNNG